MNITSQDALLVNSILFLFGFITVLFVISKYRDRLSNLNNFGYYFLFSSIGSLLMYFEEDAPYFLTIIIANYVIILGGISMVVGISRFYNKKVNYKVFLIFSIVFLISLIYFTYGNSSFIARTIIFGVSVIMVHFHTLKILHVNRKEKNCEIDLLTIMISIFILSLFIRGALLLLSEIPNTVFENYDFLPLNTIFLGISGSLISAGIISLINMRLLNEVEESESIFSNFVGNSPVPAMVHAEDGEIIYLSEVFTKVTGYTLEDIPTIDAWINAAYTNEADLVREIISDLYKFKENINDNVIKIITKDGSSRTWSFHSTHIGKLSDGRNIATSVAIDITESKEKEVEVLKLQKKNIKLTKANNIAIDLAKMLVWRMNFEDRTDQNYISVNKSYAASMGWILGKNGMIPEKAFIDSISKDKEGEESYKNFTIQRERLNNNEIDEYILYNFKHINSITKEAVYLEHHTKVEERYMDGSVKVIGGYVIDVTKTKEINDKLQFEREKAQKYLDIVGTMLIALDVDGNITLINNKGCEILEVEEKEALGKNWFDEFLPKELNAEIKKVFSAVFSKEEEMATNYENSIITKTGKVKMINWYNSILYDIKGNIIGIISSGEDVTEKRKYEENLRELGYKDTLTGLYNRRYYEEKLKLLDNESNYPITLVMGDINGLKLINDAFGHDAGDELLISAARVIKNTCRETDLVARIGGDEFVVTMPSTTEEEAERIISKIHQKLKLISIESIQLSISFGIKTKYNGEEDIQETYRAAEDLMYREKLLEIPSMRSGAIETILNTLYEKDKNSELHSRTVSLLCEKIAKASGMSRQNIAETKTAGLLHDIGKIIISLSIINKEGKLTKSEYTTMKTHSEIGFRILNSTSDMRGISNIVLCHHERWDGKGYPRGIKAEEIPLKARIITIADAYDAMTSERTYRDTISKEDALKEIIANSGTQFDPKLVKIFTKHFKDITNE